MKKAACKSVFFIGPGRRQSQTGEGAVMDEMDGMDLMDEVSQVRGAWVHAVHFVHFVHPVQAAYSFLSRYKFPSASSDVPTISRNETELMTGVEPSRTCR